MLKLSIVYCSLSGNTEECAEIIKNELSKFTDNISVLPVGSADVVAKVKESDIVFIGSYTWGDGEMPSDMRKQLKQIIDLNLPPVAVFGTGDSQYTYYCRTVDEIEFHLKKRTEVVGKLKIEQSPRGSQENKVRNWADKIIRECFRNE